MNFHCRHLIIEAAAILFNNWSNGFVHRLAPWVLRTLVRLYITNFLVVGVEVSSDTSTMHTV